VHILSWFIRNGVDHIRTKLYVGDYRSLLNPLLVIERKNSILELASNVGKEHARFKAELERLDSIGGRMVLLVEETTNITDWQHARSEMKGETIQKILNTWQQKHCMTVVQCERHESGKTIAEILLGRN